MGWWPSKSFFLTGIKLGPPASAVNRLTNTLKVANNLIAGNKMLAHGNYRKTLQFSPDLSLVRNEVWWKGRGAY